MLAERVATENLRLKPEDHLPRVRSMKVSFMSAINMSKPVTVRAQAVSREHTVVDISGGDYICTNCHLNWDHPPQARL